MPLSDKINIALCILSFILAAISVITVVVTLRQNGKMIENSTRPYVVVKYEAIQYPDKLARYVVVKNYGQTGATIIDLKFSGTMSELFGTQFKKLLGAFLAPQQSFLYYFGERNPQEPEILQIDYTYSAPNGKTYSESVSLRMITGTIVHRSTHQDADSFVQQMMLEHML